jgi:hypothetical protein
MSKTFTVQVPDQLWVDIWDTNKTESYTYSGPDTLYVLVSSENNEVIEWSLEPIPSPENAIVVTVDATNSDNLPIAHYLHSDISEHEYTYEDETNHDGSVYQKITNPTIQDYFDILYDNDNGLQLTLTLKQTKTIAETQGIIDTFLSNMNDYMTKMSTVYPWKYVTIDENDIPKIPASLVSVFSTLPEMD